MSAATNLRVGKEEAKSYAIKPSRERERKQFVFFFPSPRAPKRKREERKKERKRKERKKEEGKKE